MSAQLPSGDRLQWMETFVRIVEAGSLSSAASQLHTTQPTISRRLQALERALGIRLIQRTTHTMRLTADGERCYEQAKSLLAGWAAFEADLQGAHHEPSGTLRVTMPHAFGQDQFVEPLAGFLARYPRVDVEWILRDEVRDFVGAGIDCAVQVGMPRDPGVIAVRLGDVPRIAVASPALVTDKRTRDPRDLAKLPWLALRQYYLHDVELTHGKSGETQRFDIRPRMVTDNLYALRSACRLGTGACLGSAWLLRDDLATGRLIHLAPSWRAAALPVYLVYPRAQFYPSRLLRFIETMRAITPVITAR